MTKYSEKDLISVIMPSLNSEKFISDAIISVINQSYSNWELIIVDAQSSDETKDIVSKFSFKDKRIRFINNRNDKGPAHARANGIRASNGNFVAFLDADDLWHEKKLEKQLSFMKRNNYSFSYSLFENISEEGESLRVSKSCIHYDFNKTLRTRGIGCLTVMLERKLLSSDVIKLDSKKHGEDYLWWLSIMKKNINAYGLMEVLAKYRNLKYGLSSKRLNHYKSLWDSYRNVLGLNIFKTSISFFLLGISKLKTKFI